MEIGAVGGRGKGAAHSLLSKDDGRGRPDIGLVMLKLGMWVRIRLDVFAIPDNNGQSKAVMYGWKTGGGGGGGGCCSVFGTGGGS